MAIITNKPASFTKGQSVTLNLNKVELKAHAAITDAFFQDDTNWKTVSVEYKNSEGQKKQLVFDASLGTPSAPFFASTKARGDFEVQSVTIFDKDGGVFKIPASALNVAEFAISFTPPAPSALYTASFAGRSTFTAPESSSSESVSLLGGRIIHDIADNGYGEYWSDYEHESFGFAFQSDVTYKIVLKDFQNNGWPNITEVYCGISDTDPSAPSITGNMVGNDYEIVVSPKSNITYGNYFKIGFGHSSALEASYSAIEVYSV